jgi:NDP-sugar pyrophosphorylase family protein
MVAVILAGGKGTRLQPYTDNLPKPLVKVGDTPIIEILLRQLKKGGVSKAIVALNHMGSQIQKVLGDGSRLGLEIVYSHEDQPLSTVGPLRLIDDLPEHFIVANGDILSDINVATLFDEHLRSGAPITVATYQRSEKMDYGVLELDHDDKVSGFREKPDYEFTVSMGIYVFSRSVLEYVPQGKRFGFDDLMLTLLSSRQSINTFPYDGYWLDIGRPADYRQANLDIERIKGLMG